MNIIQIQFFNTATMYVCFSKVIAGNISDKKLVKENLNMISTNKLPSRVFSLQYNFNIF